jgi:hypothetical protein
MQRSSPVVRRETQEYTGKKWIGRLLGQYRFDPKSSVFAWEPADPYTIDLPDFRERPAHLFPVHFVKGHARLPRDHGDRPCPVCGGSLTSKVIRGQRGCGIDADRIPEGAEMPDYWCNDCGEKFHIGGPLWRSPEWQKIFARDDAAA